MLLARALGSIKSEVAKLAFLRQLGAHEWDLSDLNPNRRKFLAQVGRRSTSQTLQRMPDRRRYPILVVLLHETTLDLVDEIVDLFNRALKKTDSRSRRELEAWRVATAQASNEKVRLFSRLGRLVLDPDIPDEQMRRRIVGRRSTSQTLQRMLFDQAVGTDVEIEIRADSGFPILVVLLHETTLDLVDEIVDLFNRALKKTDSRSRRELEAWRVATAQASNEKVRLFSRLGRLVLDPDIPDEQMRRRIVGRRSTSQTLQRMPDRRRYPILVALLHETTLDLVDEIVDLFNRALQKTDSRSRRELEAWRVATAQASNEKVRLFSRLGRLVLDPDIPDEQLRRRIFEEVASRELFAAAVEETEQLLRPRDGSYLDFVENRYGHPQEIRSTGPEGAGRTRA